MAAFPFALLAGFSTIYNRIDVLMIGHYRGYYRRRLLYGGVQIFRFTGIFPRCRIAFYLPGVYGHDGEA